MQPATTPHSHIADQDAKARAHAEFHTLQVESQVLLIERDAIADLALNHGMDPAVTSWIGRAAYVLRAVANA